MSLLSVQQGSRNHRIYQAVGWLVAAVVIVCVPFWTVGVPSFSLGGNTFTIGLSNVNLAVAYIVGILGLGVLIGYNGQISLGNSFFIGVGAYVTAILVTDGWPYLATLVIVLPVTFLLGVLFGIPALRIRGLYLALVTLGLAAVFPAVVRLDKVSDRTGGANGKRIPTDISPPSWLDLHQVRKGLSDIPVVGNTFFGDGRLGGIDANDVWTYFLLVFLAAIAFWLTWNLVHSRPGRAIIAIRDNEIGAVVMGVNAPLTKTLTFGTSAALGGLAGTMYGMAVRFVAPDVFGINLAIFLIVGLVVGGVATLSGPVIGGLAIVFIPQWSSQVQNIAGVPERVLRGPTGTLILGALLILLTFVLPGGIVYGLRRLRARLITIAPATGVVPPTAGNGVASDVTLHKEEVAKDILDRKSTHTSSELDTSTAPTSTQGRPDEG